MVAGGVMLSDLKFIMLWQLLLQKMRGGAHLCGWHSVRAGAW
jgi:hypothetical protein